MRDSGVPLSSIPLPTNPSQAVPVDSTPIAAISIAPSDFPEPNVAEQTSQWVLSQSMGVLGKITINYFIILEL